jgi:hypothetical protein
MSHRLSSCRATLDVSHERFRESEVLRCVFERMVATRIAAGLVGGEAFSIDASLIRETSTRRNARRVTRPSIGPSQQRHHARSQSISRRSMRRTPRKAETMAMAIASHRSRFR